jgi:iron complex transport system substrate-binding protein
MSARLARLLLLFACIGPCACARTPAESQGKPGARPPAASVAADVEYDTRRVVVLGAGLTETVFALGLGDRVVGVDSTSVFPEAAARLPRVGSHRQLAAEGVLALEPSLIVLSAQTGPRLVRQQLAAAGVPLLTLSEEPTLAATKQRILTLGRALDRAERARALVDEIEAELARVERIVGSTANKPRTLFVYTRGQGTPFVAGRETTPAALIELAGGTLAVDAFKGFRPLTAESALLAAPEYIVIPARGLDSVGGASALLETPGLHATPAALQRNIVAIEDVKVLSFGPRVAEAVRELAQALHPELDLSLPGQAPLANGGPS